MIEVGTGITKTKWGQRVQQARKNGRFTANDKIDVINFNYCKVGELVRNNWRIGFKTLYTAKEGVCLHKMGAGELENLGERFSYAVCGNRIDEALKLLRKIEEWEIAKRRK